MFVSQAKWCGMETIMKKNLYVFLVLWCVLLLTACSTENESDSMSAIDTEKISNIDALGKSKDFTDPNNELNDGKDNNVKNIVIVDEKEMTMEELRILSTKETLSKEDFSPFKNRITTRLRSTEAIEGFSYEIIDGSEVFYLDVSYHIASDKINGAFLYNENIENMQRSDIRTGVIEPVLEGSLRMSDYVEFLLPDNVIEGDFDIYLGYYGGCEFLTNDIKVGSVYYVSTNNLCPLIVDNEIIELRGTTSRAIQNLETEQVLSLEVPCYLCLEVNEDSNEKSWCGYFFQPESEFGYAFMLDANQFEKEDIFAVLESVSFIERAFPEGVLNFTIDM